MTRGKIRIGLAGLGFGAEFVPIYLDHPDVASVAVCDADAVRMGYCAERFGIRRRFNDLAEILQADDIDAVHLVTGIPDHARQAADETAEITLGADKGYVAQEFITALTELNVIPHVAQKTSHRRSAVPDGIAGSDGYAISQQMRKLIEQGFGWAKFIGRIRQVIVRGLENVDQLFALTMTAYNLTRMRTLGAIRPLGAI